MHGRPTKYFKTFCVGAIFIGAIFLIAFKFSGNNDKKYGEFVLTEKTQILITSNENEIEEIQSNASYLKSKLEVATGFNFNISKSDVEKDESIFLKIDKSQKELGNEGYKILVTEKGVVITAYMPEGISKGIETLIQMLPAEIEKDILVWNVVWRIECCEIKDIP